MKGTERYKKHSSIKITEIYLNLYRLPKVEYLRKMIHFRISKVRIPQFPHYYSVLQYIKFLLRTSYIFIKNTSMEIPPLS